MMHDTVEEAWSSGPGYRPVNRAPDAHVGMTEFGLQVWHDKEFGRLVTDDPSIHLTMLRHAGSGVHYVLVLAYDGRSTAFFGIDGYMYPKPMRDEGREDWIVDHVGGPVLLYKMEKMVRAFRKKQPVNAVLNKYDFAPNHRFDDFEDQERALSLLEQVMSAWVNMNGLSNRIVFTDNFEAKRNAGSFYSTQEKDT